MGRRRNMHIYIYIHIFTRLKTETPYKRDIPEDSSGQGKRVSKDRASKRSEIEGTKLFQPAANALSESSTRPLWVKKKKEKFFFWKLHPAAALWQSRYSLRLAFAFPSLPRQAKKEVSNWKSWRWVRRFNRNKKFRKRERERERDCPWSGWRRI